MAIKKADAKRKKALKLLVYGDSGVGKTHFSLQSTPGKILIFDAESGSDLFEGRENFKFDYWTNEDGQKTASIKELNKAIDYLETKEGIKNYETFIVDPISDIWENLQLQRSDYKDQLLKNKGLGNKVEERNEAALESFNQKDWGDIKKKYKQMMLRLKNLSQNVILIAREKELTETKPNGDIIKLGEYIPDCEKNTKYAVDFVVRLTYNDATNERKAIINKSRGEGLEKGTIFNNPTFEIFDKMINSMKDAKEKAVGSDIKDENIFVDEDLNLTIKPLQQKVMDLAVCLGGSKNEDVLKTLEEFKIKNPLNCENKEILENLIKKLEMIKENKEKKNEINK